MEPDVIIKDFILGIPPFDQEDDTLVIEYFCSNFENLSSLESHVLNNEYCFDKKLTIFSQIDPQSCLDSRLSNMSRTLQLTLMVMLGSYHHDDIYYFGQFMILLHNFYINVITSDADSLLRDYCFLHVKFFNPQGMKFNLTIPLPLPYPTSRKSIICDVETQTDLNTSFTSSINKFHLHDIMDCGKHVNFTYDMDLSLFNIPCISFPKGYFHDPIADSLEATYQFEAMYHGLYLYVLH